MKVTVATRQMCVSLRIYNFSPCVALYVALTLHYVALKRPSFFCTNVQCRALSCQTVAQGTLSNARHPAGTQALGEGLYAAPFLGMETRHGFGAAGWVLPGSDKGRIQVGQQNVGNILSRKNSSQVRSWDDRALPARAQLLELTVSTEVSEASEASSRGRAHPWTPEARQEEQPCQQHHRRELAGTRGAPQEPDRGQAGS